jgi:hypothetical protein
MRMAPEESLLHRVEQVNLFLLLLFTVGAWYAADAQVALSVFIGSVLTSCGYFFLKHTVGKLVQAFSAEQTRTKSFALKFYAHLLGMVLLLIVVSMNVRIHIIGLLLGLSTITLSILTVFCVQGGLDLLKKMKKHKGV